MKPVSHCLLEILFPPSRCFPSSVALGSGQVGNGQRCAAPLGETEDRDPVIVVQSGAQTPGQPLS